MFSNLNPFNQPIILKTVNKLIGYGAKQEASDIQLEIIKDGSLEAKFKAFGQFIETLYFEEKIAEGVFNKIKQLANLDTKNISGTFKWELGENSFKITGAIIKTERGEIINLKIKALKSELLFLDELGLQPQAFQLMADNLYTKGLMVISSPAHNGKSITALACLLACNSINFNIYSLSTTNLLKMRGLNQIVVKNNTARSWQEAISVVSKQDPDIIFLDEPPADLEAKNLATLSNGKTIIIGLTASSNTEAIKQLLSMGLLNGVAEPKFNFLVNQRLVRRLCPDCCFAYELNEQIYQELTNNFEILDQDLIGLQLYHAQGCPSCNHTGYSGQIGLFEVLKTNQKTEQILEQSPELSLVEDGFIKALQGLTTIEELKRVL